MTMNRILALFSTGLLLAVSAAAQCVGAPGVLIGVGDDTAFTTHYALGFSMPVSGSALGTYTHFKLGTNGWITLTNGVTTPAGQPAAASPYGSSTVLAGLTAGYAPRIAPFWKDMTVTAPGGITYDNTTNAGVSCRILFKDTRDYNILPTKSYEAELFATGAVTFRYSGMNVNSAGAAFVGVSRGNAQPVVAASDLSVAGGSAGVGYVWQTFATGTFDLGATALTFTPDGVGGWNWGTTECANHSSYNKGCYGPQANEAFYEFFATPLDTSTQLTGTSITLTPTGTGYAVVNGGGAYVAPSGLATVLTAGDDIEVNVVPSVAFPHVSGNIATLSVNTNGIVNMAAIPSGNDVTCWGDPLPLLSDPVSAFRMNGDYDTSLSPGQIKYEEVSNILIITWENTERYGVNGTSDRMQMQLNLLSGVVVYVWDSMGNAGLNTALTTCVGYAPGGGSFNPGSIDLATALPIVTTPDLAMSPLTLAAAPAPTFVLLNPSVPITYTTTNLVDLSPALPGFYLAAMAFSINTPPPAPGFDLTFIGLDAPGCDLNVSTIDVYYPISPVAATHNEVIVVPQPLAPGDTFYVQTVNFIIPNSLPNGLNNVGIITSNGIRSYFQTY
jgi:hypothetical protein